MTVTSDPVRPPVVGVPRLLSSPGADLATHVGHFGPCPAGGPGLIAEVDRAGLRGRGGAAFPTAVKLAAVARGRQPVVVVNATEGEPVSAKDKTLLVSSPHLVLDGAAVAAGIVGARRIIVCIDRAVSAAVAAVEHALAERRSSGLDRPLEMVVASTPSRYIAGEESALVHWLNGGEARPTFIPPRPFEKGVGGRPTLVDNAETLAHLALIARYGAEWFRAVGTEEHPGSSLVTVSYGPGSVSVYEIELGVPLTNVLAHAGVDPGAIQAVLVGGYFGAWVAASELAGVRLDNESLAPFGSGFGCGAVTPLPVGVCGLAEAARAARWLAGENAGQCGPCMFGLPAIAGAMDALVAGDGGGKAEHAVRRWVEMVKGRGACRHPDGAVRFVESSLRVFAGEIARHRRYGPCPPSAPILPCPAPGGWR